MGISLPTGFSGNGGGGGRSRTFWNPFRTGSTNKSGNDLVIVGSTVLILIACFVGGCGGKPFHPVGQAEVEEDTTQGSLKEKFPESLASVFGHDEVSSGKHPIVAGILLDGNEMDSDDDDEAMDPLENEAWLSAQDLKKQYERLNPGYGVNKRSLGIGRQLPLPLSRNDGTVDESFFGQKPTRFSSSNALSTSGESTASGHRIRQKIATLRNQFGDRWFNYVAPFAYRKRQILYRQCFFNPISCF